MKKIVVALLFLFAGSYCFAQIPSKPRMNTNGSTTLPSGQATTGNKDSLGILGFEHRDDAKDSVTLTYRLLDSVTTRRLDSSITDFYKYFPIPQNLQYLGNDGNAGYALQYSPVMKAGWDAGFHAYDAYMYTLDNAKLYKASKPFSQLNYELATGKEQILRAFHTQNPKPNLNFGFDYRLISAPGFFITQNTNHNSYNFFSNYQGKRKRYAAVFNIVGNKIKSSENGGMQSDSFLHKSEYAKLFTIPVNLGGDAPYEPNPFKASVTTGNIYKNFTFFLRQSYDIGKKDSVEVNDSTTEYLFYPKLRFQYSFTYGTQSYQFQDFMADSAVYQSWYDTTLKKTFDTISIVDKWKIMTNDFSLVQFPDTKNQAQFFLVGARLENIKGEFDNGSTSFHNILLRAEYRNKTRNKKWDILAKGEFYANGYNSGDYNVYGTLARFIGKKWGSVRLTFNNVNKSPSAIYAGATSFNLGNTASFNKENITLLKAEADNPFFTVSVANYFISNLLYLNDLYHTDQYSKVFNVLQISASKKIKLARNINWYADVTLQQTDNASPVRVPAFFTRNRIAFEGRFYRNLNLFTGIEFRYYSNYKGYNYSPLMGQFVPQDTFTIKNRPDISAFVHFRIRSFTAFIRAENLNTMSFENGFGFSHNNYSAPLYVYPGFLFRFGIQWWFVN